jgi:hypothetical protein
MLAFKRDHTIFEEELQPTVFWCDRPSYFPPTELIPFQIKGTLKRKRNLVVDEEKPPKHAKLGPKAETNKGGLKHQRDDESDQQKSPKDVKVGQKKEGKSAGKNSM